MAKKLTKTRSRRPVERLVRQTAATFRERADRWETDEADLGKIVAGELRVVIDAFEEILTPPNAQAQAQPPEPDAACNDDVGVS